MPLLPQLNALCEVIRSRVTIPVVLGRPDAAAPGLYVWPWRLEVNAEGSNRPPLPHAGGTTPSINQPTFATHVLLLSIPALSAGGLESLEAAQLALFDHPLLMVDGAHSRIVQETSLTLGDLSALFIAAQLPLSICGAFVVSGQTPADVG